MPGKIARRTQNLIRKTVGTINRKPRIVCVTGLLARPANSTPSALYGDLEFYGYIDVNKNATTPFSRGKVHKGFFCCQTADIANGDLVYDRADQRYYFVMDRKMEVYNGEEVYVNATMYRCDSKIEIQRFSTGPRDTFGRTVQDTANSIATDVFAMFNPQNFDIKEQQDRLIADNKIKLCIQSKYDIQVADRVITDKGKKYHVTLIDDVSLENLVLCTVDTDVR